MKKNLLKLSLLLLCAVYSALAYGQTKTDDVNGIDPGIVHSPGDTTKESPRIYSVVEWMPEPKFNMTDYLIKNLVYPKAAMKAKIQGKVIVQFVVNEEGSVSNAKIIRGIGGGCDEEALRVVNGMPKWKPGMTDGKPVKVYYAQPITFRL